MGTKTNVYTLGLTDAENEAIKVLEAQSESGLSFVPTTIEALATLDVWDHSLLLYSFTTKAEEGAERLKDLDDLSALQMKHGSIPWIGVVRDIDPMATFLIQHAGAIGVWTFSSNLEPLAELLSTVEPSTRQDTSKPFPLLSLLYFACAFQETVIFRIRSKDAESDTGFVLTSEGQLHYGKTMAGLLGDAAVLELMSWTNAEIHIMKPQMVLRENVKGSLEDSLMRMARLWRARQQALGVVVPRERTKTPRRPPPVRGADTPVPIGLELLPLASPNVQKLQARLGAICQEAVEGNESVVACGVVDLRAGTLPELHHRLPQTPTLANAIRKMTMNAFFAPYILELDRSILTDTEEEAAPREAFVRSANALCFMRRLSNCDSAIVLLTKQSANQGLGWFELGNCCAKANALQPDADDIDDGDDVDDVDGVDGADGTGALHV